MAISKNEELDFGRPLHEHIQQNRLANKKPLSFICQLATSYYSSTENDIHTHTHKKEGDGSFGNLLAPSLLLKLKFPKH